MSEYSYLFELVLLSFVNISNSFFSCPDGKSNILLYSGMSFIEVIESNGGILHLTPKVRGYIQKIKNKKKINIHYHLAVAFVIIVTIIIFKLCCF